MDPVTITTTVITFAGVAIQSAKAVYDVIDGVHDAPQTIAHSKTLLCGTDSALGALTEILTDNAHLHSEFDPVLQRLNLRNTLTETDELCKKFGDTLKKCTSRSTEASFSKRDRIYVNMHEAQVAQFNKKLTECQSTISLLTQTITVIFDTKILNHIQAMGTQIDNLERGLSKLIADLANKTVSISQDLEPRIREGGVMINSEDNEKFDLHRTQVLMESSRAARDALTEKKQISQTYGHTEATQSSVAEGVFGKTQGEVKQSFGTLNAKDSKVVRAYVDSSESLNNFF